MARVLLLDFDRTLVDAQSHTDYCAAMRELRAWLKDQPRAAVPDTDWDQCASACMEILVALAGSDLWQRASDRIEAHELAIVDDATPMPGLRTFLDRIDGYPRAVVTLCPETMTRELLARHDIPFDALVPRRADLAPKPAPDQVLAALAALDADPDDALMVGDSTWDRAAAQAAGVGFIGLTNGRDRHGFPPDTRIAADLSEAADLIEAEEGV